MKNLEIEPFAPLTPERSNRSTTIRVAFPRVYEQFDRRTESPYWVVDARSKRWGMCQRKCFGTKKAALDHARQIEQQIQRFGAQSEMPKEKMAMAQSYESLAARLAPFGWKLEDVVEQFIQQIGEEALRKTKPPIRDLVEQWKTYKLTDSTLSSKYKIEIEQYCRFIKRTWGDSKPDDLNRNDIEVLLRKLTCTNNTRRKHLRYVRMFHSWLKSERYISEDPTDGIFFKPDDPEAAFYGVETTSRLLRHVAEHEKDLSGYYALLTFAGLRPSEGARVEWQDINWKANELYVRKGKTNARYIILEPVAAEWLKWHRGYTAADAPFLPKKNLANREKKVRAHVLNGDWIQDGLRHGFATYYRNKIGDVGKVADYMGNSATMVKRHYARTIPIDEREQFWALTPAVVLAETAGQNGKK